MSQRVFKLKSKVFLYPGVAGWHFIGIPKTESNTIKMRFRSSRRGWGSLPVVVKLGSSVWKTSIFPDSKSGVYLLPLKAQVRKKEGLGDRDPVAFSIEVMA